MIVLTALVGLVLMAAMPSGAADAPAGKNPWHRLYPGVTLLMDNPDGKGFEFSLDVQDLNLLEAGPREVLVKVYQPDGTTAVREVLPDDGITSGGLIPAYSAWDHEGWYYGYCYATGSTPAFRFSMPTEPDQIAQRATRSFKWNIPGGTPGIYRAVVVGSADHLIKIGTSTNLAYAVAGNDNWLHAGPGQYKKSYFLVPQDATKLHLMFIEYDQPNNRGFTIRDPDGKVVLEGTAQGGFNKVELDLVKKPEPAEKPGAAKKAETPAKQEKPVRTDLAGKVLSFEITEGKNACMFHLAMVLPKPEFVKMRGTLSVNAAMAPTPELATKAANGAIMVDGVRFWQPWQPALHKWATSLKDADVTPMVDGKPAAFGKPLNGFAGVTQMDNFQNSNGPHWRAPACDVILFNWGKSGKNKQELNYALRDLAQGLLAIGPNDHVAAGPIANLGYEFSNYAYQYWRPSWRVLTQIKSDVPAEVVQGVSKAMITGGDRLAFCRDWPRVNGNAFAQVVGSLRYISVASGDALQASLYQIFRDRFINGGWGERAGAGASGFVQEGFGYDHHYGSYILETWPALLADVPEPVLQSTFDRLWNGYTYTCAISTYGVPKGPKDVYRHYAACPWSSRTHMAPAFEIPTEGPRRLKALPGPDFTETVNGGNEFFAARRPSYYALTYHGRLSPEYSGYGFDGEIGFGGGALCQVYVPEKGLVIASTVNDSYGHGMARSNWRNFHLHSLVGTMADGRPLVSAASEHPDAKLTGTTVTSTGEVRGANVKVKRAYTFENGKIQCELGLAQSGYDSMFQLWKPSPERTTVAEAFEMIPFYSPAKPGANDPATKVTAEGAALTDKPVKTQKVTIDRGGFGVNVNLPAPMNVSLGKNNTLLLHIVEKPTPAKQVELKYELEVFGK
jgi:hypothetical protein